MLYNGSVRGGCGLRSLLVLTFGHHPSVFSIQSYNIEKSTVFDMHPVQAAVAFETISSRALIA